VFTSRLKVHLDFRSRNADFSRLLVFPVFLLALFSFSAAANAQDDLELMPPPLKIFSKEERTRLTEKTDLKDRTKLTLEIMNLRLAAAENANVRKDFDAVFRDLGAFHALMDHSLVFVGSQYNGSGKALDSFKRIDIALRGFIPRIESIRRDVPLVYEDYIRKLLISVREARTKATEPMFADTVVRQPRRTEPEN